MDIYIYIYIYIYTHRCINIYTLQIGYSSGWWTQSKFELQSGYYPQFQTNTRLEMYDPPPAKGLIVFLLFLYKNSSGIK